jgi:hypothetical protein
VSSVIATVRTNVSVCFLLVKSRDGVTNNVDADTREVRVRQNSSASVRAKTSVLYIANFCLPCVEKKSVQISYWESARWLTKSIFDVLFPMIHDALNAFHFQTLCTNCSHSHVSSPIQVLLHKQLATDDKDIEKSQGSTTIC